MKEYIVCRDACYTKADQAREQWAAALNECQETFDAAVQACFQQPTDPEFMDCYRRANEAFQECRSEAERAYQEAMGEVAVCIEVCKGKFEECSK